MPRGMRDVAAYGIGYGAQVTAYAYLLTDRYPDAAPGRCCRARNSGPPRGAHPLRRPGPAAPHRRLPSTSRAAAPVLADAGRSVALAAVAAWVAALAVGRVPLVLHRFLAAFVRTTTHVSAFLYVVGRPYPGFVGEGTYPIDLTIAAPDRQRRLGVLVRVALAVPALLLSSAWGAVLVVGALGWVAALVAGRMPTGLRDAGAAALH